MEKSALYDLVGQKILHIWLSDIQNSEIGQRYITAQQNALDKLTPLLNEQAQTLLKRYVHTIENKLEYQEYILNIKMLNFGAQIGQELQIYISEYDLID